MHRLSIQDGAVCVFGGNRMYDRDRLAKTTFCLQLFEWHRQKHTLFNSYKATETKYNHRLL